MKIIYKTGDLLDAEERIIAHGCNAKGVMGAGVALAIKKKWPAAYHDYRKEFDFNPHSLYLGRVIYSKVDINYRVIAHCITQATYGRAKKQYVDYDAVRYAIRTLNSDLDNGKPFSVAMPMIGAGLAGGDWFIIEKIIESEAVSFQPVVYKLED